MQKAPFLFLLLFCFFLYVGAQDCPAGTSFQRKDLSPLTNQTEIPFNVDDFVTCNVHPSTKILGYDHSSFSPIYLNQCEGFCVSVGNNTKTCNPTLSTIKLLASNHSTAVLKEVKQITSCSCSTPLSSFGSFAVQQNCPTGNNCCQSMDPDSGVRTYSNGAFGYDSCMRRCLCSNGNFINCCRVRKEFTQMPMQERRRFIRAFLYASRSPRFQSQFNTIIAYHGTYFYQGIHSNGQFFPWHRWYVYTLENLLRQIDCRVTIPYWEWSNDAGDPTRSIAWSSGPSYLGGNGRPCVSDGVFSQAQWTVMQSQFMNGCLQRNFSRNGIHGKDYVQRIVDVYSSSQYDQFRIDVQVNLHNLFHTWVGGHMMIEESSKSPEFWLHHGYLDKLWTDWQYKGTSYMTAYSGSETLVGTNVAARSFLNPTRQPNEVCVLYQGGRQDTWISDALRALTLNDFSTIPSATTIKGMTEDDLLKRGFSRKDIDFVFSLRKQDEETIPHVPSSELKSNISKQHGFSIEDMVSILVSKNQLSVDGCVRAS